MVDNFFMKNESTSLCQKCGTFCQCVHLFSQ